MMALRTFLLALVTTMIATPAIAQTYHPAGAVPLGAPDRWDYVVANDATGRVYVAHGDRVAVVDGRAGKVIGEIVGMPGGTHGTGIVGSLGVTDDGDAGQAVVFDPHTLKVLRRIRAAATPTASPSIPPRAMRSPIKATAPAWRDYETFKRGVFEGEPFTQTFRDVHVRIHGALADVDLVYVNTDASGAHPGYKTMQLIRVNGTWKIASELFTGLPERAR